MARTPPTGGQSSCSIDTETREQAPLGKSVLHDLEYTERDLKYVPQWKRPRGYFQRKDGMLVSGVFVSPLTLVLRSPCWDAGACD